MTRTGPAPLDALRETVPSPASQELTPAVRRSEVWARRASLVLVALGVLLRVRQWAGGRSLWLDEALIARSLVERDHLRLLTEPLLHNQAAPQGWLQATRLSVDLLGGGERSLRLVSLLAGCAALLLVLRLASRLLPAVAVPVAVGLCALHPDLVYFSNEVKPYSSDVLVVLVVVLVALRDRPLLLGLTGAAAVWCAYPSVFVLAGASLLLVLRRPTLRERVRTALLLLPWLTSLAAAYVLVLAPLRAREVYDLYWAYAYPRSAADLPDWALRRAVELASSPLRLAVPLLALAVLVVGAVRLLRREPRAGAFALVGLPFAVLAGAVGAYPLADRLVLWAVPLVAVLLAAALPPRRGVALAAAVTALALTAGPAVVSALPLAVRTRHVEELRPVLGQVAAQRQPGDLVLVDIAAKAAFDHYGPPLGLRRDGVVLFATPPPGQGCGDDLVALRTGRFGNGRVWLVLSHELLEGPVLGSRDDLLGRLGRVTRLVRRVHAPGAEAFLLSPRRGGQDIPPGPLTPDRCLVVNRSPA